MKPHNRRMLLLYEDDFYGGAAAAAPPIVLSQPPPRASTSSTSTSTTARHMVRQHPPPPPPTEQMNPPLDSSMALTVLVLLSALFFLGFFSLYIRRFATESSRAASSTSISYRRRRMGIDSPRLQPDRHPSCSANHKGVDPAVIRSLPAVAYGGGTKYQMDCPVCLSEFEEKETVKVIPHCEHVFHPQCIDRWLYTHMSCPVCRSTQLVDAKGHSCGSGEATVDQSASENPPVTCTAPGPLDVKLEFDPLRLGYSSRSGGSNEQLSG